MRRITIYVQDEMLLALTMVNLKNQYQALINQMVTARDVKRCKSGVNVVVGGVLVVVTSSLGATSHMNV